MKTGTRRLTLGSLIVLSLAAGAQAAEPSGDSQSGSRRQTVLQWKLSTDDTEVILSVSDNRIFLASLKNPAQNWNWAPVPCEVPLPDKNSIVTGRNRRFPALDLLRRDGRQIGWVRVTLRFTSTTPNLELKSVWRAHPGPGPVENWVTIENKSGGDVIYSPKIVAARLQIKADETVTSAPRGQDRRRQGEGVL